MRLAVILSAALLYAGAAWAEPAREPAAAGAHARAEVARDRTREAVGRLRSDLLSIQAREDAAKARERARATALARRPVAWTVYSGATELQVRDAVAILRIETEDRPDVAVSIENAGPLPTPQARRSGRRLVIDGDIGRIQNCGERHVGAGRRGRVDWDDAPRIRVRMPRDANVSVSGAVRTNISPTANARLSFSGCADAVFGRVDGDLVMALAGGGSAQGGSARRAEVSVAGAGDVIIGEVARDLTVSIAGSGDVRTGIVRGGDVRVVIQGAGDVEIGGGQAGAVTVFVAGAGDVRFPGRARTLDVFVAGAGDVVVGEVTGTVKRRIFGGGEVTVGGGQ